MPNNKEECFSSTISDEDEIEEDIGMSLDTCCFLKVSLKVIDQSVTYTYCEPIQKSKAKKFINKFEDEMSAYSQAYDIRASIDCFSSYIKYGLSFLMILLLN